MPDRSPGPGSGKGHQDQDGPVCTETVPERTEGVLLEAGILDGQLLCLHGWKYYQEYGGTIYPETGAETNVRICAAGIHIRSCGGSYGRGTLQKFGRKEKLCVRIMQKSIGIL